MNTHLFRHSLGKALGWLMLVAPIVLFYWFVVYYALGTFHWDDFDLIYYLVGLKHGDFWDGLRATFAQQNEHRIGVPRLLTLLNYKLFGTVNWTVLNVSSTPLVLGIAALGGHVAWRMGRSVWYLVPIAFFLFQLQYYSCVFPIFIVPQQVGVLFLGFLTVRLLANGSDRAGAWALVAAFAATFSNGNGLFVFVAGILLLLAQRRWRFLLGWTLGMALAAGLYFWNYKTGQNSNMSESLSNPLRMLSGVFGFLGAFADVFDLPLVAVVGFGFVLTAGLLWFSLRLLARRWKDQPVQSDDYFIVGAFVFLLLTAVAASLARSWSGLESLVTVRYTHYAAAMLMLCYLALLRGFQGTKSSWVVLGSVMLGALFNVCSYYTYARGVVELYQVNVAEGFNWRHNERFATYPLFMNLSMKESINEALVRGIHRFPPTALSAHQTELLAPVDTTVPDGTPLRITRQSRAIIDNSTHHEFPFFLIENTSVPPASGSPDAGTYLVLKSDSHTYVFPTRQRASGRRVFFRTGQYFAPGFDAEVPTESLQPGRYRLGLFRYHGGRATIRYTALTLDV